MIILEPRGGLANRMRSLDSAIWLAAATGSPLTVLWYRNDLLNCAFTELFHFPDQITRFHDRDATRLLMRSLRRTETARLRLRSDHDFDDETILKIHQPELIDLARNRDIYISTGHRFSKQETHYCAFKPIEPLQSRIDVMTADYDSVVGIHVRRTDNRRSRLHSPTELFVELMHREVAANEETRFFLATDSPEEEVQMQMRFPDRILINQKRSLDRSNPVAIQDALVDIYCLARCRRLIGSYWSSFSEIAAHIGGIDLTVVRGDS